MNLTLINTDGNVIVHDANCADIKKDLRSAFGQRDHYSFEYASKFEAWLDYNADFLEEGSGGWELEFKPCCKLPVGNVTGEFAAQWKEQYK